MVVHNAALRRLKNGQFCTETRIVGEIALIKHVAGVTKDFSYQTAELVNRAVPLTLTVNLP